MGTTTSAAGVMVSGWIGLQGIWDNNLDMGVLKKKGVLMGGLLI